ncbi:MAG: Calx-beta domain-containing protein [Gemmataceae bacterium]
MLGFFRRTRKIPLARFIRPQLQHLEDRSVPSGVPQTWTVHGSGGGGALYAPAINPHHSSEYLIASDMGQLFQSGDGGTAWSTIPFGEIRGNTRGRVQFTNDPQILYSIDSADDQQRPSRSLDGGVNWDRLVSDPTGGDTFYLLADPGDFHRLAVSDYNNLYYSGDGGSTWSLEYTAPGDGAGLLLGGAFWDGAHIYLGTNRGVLASSDSGVSFAPLTLAGMPTGQVIVSFAGARSGGLTRFLAVTYPAADAYAGIQGYDNGGGAKVLTLDVGASGWTSRSLPADAWPFYAGMALTDVQTLYVAGGNSSAAPTVYRSSDGGATWQSVFRTENNANIATGWSGKGGDRGWSYGEIALGFTVLASDPNHLLITDYGFAHASTDGGATWQALYVAPTDRTAVGTWNTPGRAYHDSGLDNTTSWQVVWSDPTRLFIANSDIGGQISSDGGTTFGFGYAGHTRNSMYRIAQTASGLLYAATSSVHDLYQSTYLTDARIDGGNGAVLLSADQGRTWQTVHDFGRVVSWVALDPTNPERLYAAVAHSTQGGVYVTNNLSAGAASTWTRLSAPPRTEGHAYNVVVLQDGTLVATYSGRRNGAGAFTASSGVFVSTNGGQTWVDRSDPAMRYWTRDVIIDPLDATQSTWYVGVFSGWGGPPNDLGGLYRTTDRGLTWTRLLTTHRVSSATFNPSDPNEMFVTTEGEGLLYSSNLRAAVPTFTPVANYPFHQPERVFFNPYDPQEIWVTSFGGGVMVGRTGSPTPGALELVHTSYSVSETGGTISLTVRRTGGTAGAVSVDFGTEAGTALAGVDYQNTQGTLSWADGDAQTKTISVAIVDDLLVEGDETFTVRLVQPGGGATLGSQATATVTIRSDDVPPPAPGQPFAVATGAGTAARVKLYRADGTVRFSVAPFGTSYSGGLRIATGDVTGDGVADVVVGPTGGTRTTEVRVVDGQTGKLLAPRLTVGVSYRGPAAVAVGDVTGDGIADLAIGADAGPRVALYRGGDFVKLMELSPGPGLNYRGRTQVALADVNHDTLADLIVTGLYPTGVRVAGFSGQSLRPGTTAVSIFLPYFLTGASFTGGAHLAAGDVNADGFADLLLGSGAGSAARVVVVSGQTLVQTGTRTVLASFAPPGVVFGNGVRVASRDIDGDGRADLVLGAGSGRGSRVRIYLARNLSPTGSPPMQREFDAFPGLTMGVFVG